MNQKKSFFLGFFPGIAVGVILSILALFVWDSLFSQPPVLTADAVSSAAMESSLPSAAVSFAMPESDSSSVPVSNLTSSTHTPVNSPAEISSSAGSASFYPGWEADKVYTGGEEILYENRIYRAKWWTQGEQPGRADVWEDTLQTPNPASSAEPAPPSSLPSVSAPSVTPVSKSGFRIVGYCPSWKVDANTSLRYDLLTHIVYSFAIPTADGGLLPLENAEAARRIIAEAHQKQVKVLIAVGGWSYQDIPLEPTFVSATETEEKLNRFAHSILSLCEEYGFDGVDIDWEHPRVDGNSKKQYEKLILTLEKELHAKGKLLTSAVLSGATPDGNIYYDAAAQSDAVLNAVDWIHVMAYDGGDGERHSPYDFAVNSANYWKDTRKLPGDKITLGVPFYARPSWAAYGDILKTNPDADQTDFCQYNGMQAYYNGVDTIRKKTKFAKEQLGGIMIWEITQDSNDPQKSLLAAIADEAGR